MSVDEEWNNFIDNKDNIDNTNFITSKDEVKNIVDIKIKLHNYSKKDIDSFIEFLIKNPNVAEVFSVSGEWDFSIVMLAKDAYHLGKINEDVRGKFSKIIKDWSESLTTTAYKFEAYNMIKLMRHE